MSLMKHPETRTELRNQWLIVLAAFIGLVALAWSLYAPAAHADPVVQPNSAIQAPLKVQKLAPVATSRGEPIFLLVKDATKEPITIGSVTKYYDHYSAFTLVSDKCTGHKLYPNPLSCEVRYVYTEPQTKEGIGQTAVVIFRDRSGAEIGGTILMGQPTQGDAK